MALEKIIEQNQSKVKDILGSIPRMYLTNEQEAYIMSLIFKDELTGAHNYRSFEEDITNESFRQYRTLQPLSVATFDIDFFKRHNDTYGHDHGNAVLQCLSEVVKKEIRDYEKLYRTGGEEFSLIFQNMTAEESYLVCERVRQMIELSVPGMLEKRGYAPAPVTASFGVACFEEPGQWVTLMKQADRALYLAKMNGRNRTEIYYNAVAAQMEANK